MHACWNLTVSISHACNMIRSKRKEMEWNKGFTGNTVAHHAYISSYNFDQLFIDVCWSRVYPPAFGQRLLRIWESSDLGDVPLQSLRNVSTCHVNCLSAHYGKNAGEGQFPFKDKVIARFSKKWN